MKVGLLRHFKVTLGYPNRMVSAQELMEWQKEYDVSALEEKDIELGRINWKKCYSSDLGRAKHTAERVHSGEIIYFEELREITLSPINKSSARMPLWFHLFMIRIAWYLGHKSQKESRKQVLARINKVLDKAIEQEEDVLIVGHGGIMIFMRKELIKRGFSGPKFNRPENAKLYIYEK